MAFYLAAGTTVAIASAYGTSKSMSALTNANPAVATLEASHGIATGDFFEVTSGWEAANLMVVKAGTVATNDVPLLGLSTLDTNVYPTGTGTGSVREITAWTTITQIARQIDVSGGEQQYADITTLANRTEQRVPTVRSAINLRLPLFWDPALPFVAVVRAAVAAAKPVAVRFTLPGGAVIVGNANLGYQPIPTIEDNTFRSTIDLSFVADVSVYTA